MDRYDLYSCPDCEKKMTTETYKYYDGRYPPEEAEESYVWCPHCEKDQTIAVEDRMVEMSCGDTDES